METRGSKLQAVADSLLSRFENEPVPTDQEIEALNRMRELKDRNRCELAKQKEWDSFIYYRGERYDKCSFGNFELNQDLQRVAVEKLKQFCGQFSSSKRNLVLFGPAGTGKDHLLAACVREAIRSEVFGFKWTNGPRLFSALRASIGSNVSDDEVCKPFVKCNVLVVSDLAMTTLTDYQREIVYRIIDDRYNAMRPTWVSANVATKQDFEDATSPQIVDRLLHDALYVPCNWDSFRKVSK